MMKLAEEPVLALKIAFVSNIFQPIFLAFDVIWPVRPTSRTGDPIVCLQEMVLLTRPD